LSIEDQLASQQVLSTDAALFASQWRLFWANTSQLFLPFQLVPQQSSGVTLWPLWEPQISPAAVKGGLGSLLPPQGGNAQLVGLGPQGPRQAQQTPFQTAVIVGGQSQSPPQQSFAVKMIQADLLLPVIAQDSARLGDALDAIGLTTGEQETDFITFWSAVDSDLLDAPQTTTKPPLPDPGNGWKILTKSKPIPVYMTVADIVDWAKNLAGPSSVDQIRQAGALGLNLLCEQADELFWLALAMLDPTATTQQPALGDAEVQLTVVSLAQDLNLFANLAY
jgi:hypothetical protein